MFERFTKGAIKAIMCAQQDSRRLGHNFVDTEQILLGLIAEKDGIAARMLKSLGVDLKTARIEVEKIIGRGHDLIGSEIPFTPRSKRLLELSWDEARQLHHDYIGTEHLLLGMLKEKTGVGCQVLVALNVDLAKLYAQVIGACGRSASDFDLTLPPEPSLSPQPSFPIFPVDTADFNIEPFTWYAPDAILIIQRAAGIAQTFGSSEDINAIHLFLALLRDCDSIPRAIKSAGLTLTQIRQTLLKSIEPGNNSLADSLSFSVDAQKILEYAWLEGTELQLKLVTKECIMLGLLRQKDGIAAEVWKNLSANVQVIRQSLLESLKSAQQIKLVETSPAKFNDPGPPSAKKYPMWVGPYGGNYINAIVMSVGIFAIFGFVIFLIAITVYFLSIEHILVSAKDPNPILSGYLKRYQSMLGTWTDKNGSSGNYICFNKDDKGIFFKQPELPAEKVEMYWSPKELSAESVCLVVKDPSGQRTTYEAKIKLIDPTHMLIRFPYGKEHTLVRQDPEDSKP